MILAVDTHYTRAGAVTAGIFFADITDASSVFERVVASASPPAAYKPGEFYKRELPEILSFLSVLSRTPQLIIIDGYCTLDISGAPGLGNHLYEALDGAVDIIGVAKSAFRGSAHAETILRGRSQTPLYITACGIAQKNAARMIARMHGSHRIPALLKRVDQLCRGVASPE